MSFIQLSLLRSVQPIFIRTLKTKATSSTQTADDSSFLGDVRAEDENAEGASSATGRERSLNRVQLIGRVGADPKVGGTQLHKVVTFNLATNEYAGTNAKNGELKQRVDWHRVAVFQPRLLENAEKYVRQGDRLYIQGRLHHNQIRDKESGQDRYVSSIIADDMIFLTKK
jgi:single-strand DNA-binding protein